MSPTCAGCLYATPAPEAEGLLVCRRYPPQVVQLDTAVVQVQPAVTDSDWCGEHAPRPAPVPHKPTTPAVGAPLPLQRTK